jgi:hypothetical protein
VPLDLLCEPPPPPVEHGLDPPDPDLPWREAYLDLTRAADCTDCHSILDPLGLSFDHFDQRGEYRELDAGMPIDASGDVTTFGGRTLTFESSQSLVQSVAADPDFQDCVVRYLVASWVEAWASDEAAVHFADAFLRVTPEATVLDALRAFVRSEHFVTRSQLP